MKITLHKEYAVLAIAVLVILLDVVQKLLESARVLSEAQIPSEFYSNWGGTSLCISKWMSFAFLLFVLHACSCVIPKWMKLAVLSIVIMFLLMQILVV